MTDENERRKQTASAMYDKSFEKQNWRLRWLATFQNIVDWYFSLYLYDRCKWGWRFICFERQNWKPDYMVSFACSFWYMGDRHRLYVNQIE